VRELLSELLLSTTTHVSPQQKLAHSAHTEQHPEPSSTTPYRQVQPRTVKYNHVPSSTTTYRQVQPRTVKYNHVPSSTTTYHQVQPRTVKYNHVPSSTTTYRQTPQQSQVLTCCETLTWICSSTWTERTSVYDQVTAPSSHLSIVDI